MKRLLAVAIIPIVIIGLSLIATVKASPAFVSVCGTQFCIGGQVWPERGATAYGQYGNASAEVQLARQAHLNELRLAEFDCSYHNFSDVESVCTWTRVDKFVAAAEAGGLHVIFTFSEFGQSLQASGVTMNSPAWQSDWDQYLSFIAGRVNSVTGQTYGSDPGVAMVELWGEIPPPNGSGAVGTTAQINAFEHNSFVTWHNAAPNVLISSGGLSHINDPKSGIDWQTIYADPLDAACDIEINSVSDRDVTTHMVSSYCQSIGKPWYLNAWSSCYGTPRGSWDLDYYASDSAMAAHAQAMYAIAAGSSPATMPALGSDFWNLGNVAIHTGMCDIGTQFPQTFAAVQAAGSAGTPTPTPTGTPTSMPSGTPTATASPPAPPGFSGTCTVTVVNGTVTGGSCK